MGLVNLLASVRSGAVVSRQSQRNPQRRAVLRVEALEAREVPTINPSGMEQEMLELVNRMRMSPQSELSRLLTSTNPIQAVDPQVQAALAYFNVSGSTLASQWAGLTAVQPLAWSDGLLNSSRLHSQLMITKDTQSHQLPGEADLGSRITTAGYTGWSFAGENIYAYSNTVSYGHAGFAIDWGNGPGGIQSPAGHRVNLMNGSFREIGISVIAESNPNTQVGPLVITQDFGVRYNQGNAFLLGVVYSDSNHNNSYNAGEGLVGVNVSIVGGGGSYSTTTLSAGGYQLQVPAGTYTVTFSGGGLGSSISKTVTVGSANVKVDAIAGQTGNPPPPPPPTSSNHAPVLNTTATYLLPYVPAGSTNPPSMQVGTLVGSNVTDSDAGALKGIAITAVDSTLGTWQYSTTGSTSWKNLTTASNTSALLLRSTDSLRFSPKSGSTGVASFVFRAWDQTSGSAGAFVNLSAVGGSTAFSADQVFAKEQVGNTAPVLNTASPFKLNSGNAGTLVSVLLGQSVSDVDMNPLRGVAVTSLAGTANGTWQYSLDAGKTWKNMGTLSTSTVLLLRSQDLIRFVPNAGFKGTVSLQFRAWDQTTGIAGSLVNLTPSRWGNPYGGTTAYSSGLGTANLVV